MTSIEEFGVRRFEVLVTLTIGALLLLMGLPSLYIFSAACLPSATKDTVCGTTAFDIGLLTTATGMFLVVVGVVWALTSPRTQNATLPPRSRTRGFPAATALPRRGDGGLGMRKERSTVTLSYFWIAVIAGVVAFAVAGVLVLVGLWTGVIDANNRSQTFWYFMLVAVVYGVALIAILWRWDR